MKSGLAYRKTSGIFPTGDINKADEKTSLLFSMALWRNFRRSFFLKISQNYLTTGHLRLCHLTISSSRTFMSIKLGPSLQTDDDLRPLYELPELTKMTFLRLDTIKIRSSRQKNLYFTWVSFDHHYNWRRKSSESFFHYESSVSFASGSHRICEAPFNALHSCAIWAQCKNCVEHPEPIDESITCQLDCHN